MKRAFDKIADVAVVRQALVEGEQSGEPEPFDFAVFKQRKAQQLVSRIDTRYKGP
uniref:type II toxin-antitoxin system ParD family antitoxin n=1 Tax=Sphingomonas sp. TaxID=28214 RepID=UPI0015EF8775|nr:type II toxin-antitoxin system ParD family antitoxin [Sphingomonas sp.]